MTINSTAAQSKASPGYIIQNPKKVITDFTVTEESKAAKALNIKNDEQIADLKKFLKGFDMTNISLNDLKKVGSKLYDNKLIDVEAFSVFLAGRRVFDHNGKQAEKDVKFNAIALFDQRLEEQTASLGSYSDTTKQEPGFVAWRQGMIVANQAINALAYFAYSSRQDLSIDEKA
ncbi:hypothetical protein [Pseudomonas syringae]|uniref:hypothetical protein n=1 Tax=Pseudomonas syringae TaxID=317 RepID=UPI001F47B056|nr:hypothetical protein [Pseudomonas syringae]MCF5724286.1 hypothetical protein [Pseudomonas syringae]